MSAYCQECFFNEVDLESDEMMSDFDFCPDCGGELIYGDEISADDLDFEAEEP